VIIGVAEQANGGVREQLPLHAARCVILDSCAPRQLGDFDIEQAGCLGMVWVAVVATDITGAHERAVRWFGMCAGSACTTLQQVDRGKRSLQRP